MEAEDDVGGGFTQLCKRPRRLVLSIPTFSPLPPFLPLPCESCFVILSARLIRKLFWEHFDNKQSLSSQCAS